MDKNKTLKELMRDAQTKARIKSSSVKRKIKLKNVSRGNNLYRINVKSKPHKKGEQCLRKTIVKPALEELSGNGITDTLTIVEDFSNSGNQQELEDVVSEIRTAVGEACIAKLKTKKVEQLHNDKSHVKRMIGRNEHWDENRDDIHHHLISCTSFGVKKCVDCGLKTTACVKCESCARYYCWSCDFKIHTKFVLHERKVCDEYFKPTALLQNEFINSSGKLYHQDVFLSCYIPEECPFCGKTDTLNVTGGLRNIAVVTHEGRFDLKSTSFECEDDDCGTIFEAKAKHYTASGYWPGTADEKSFFLFSKSFLQLWYQLEHKSPSISNKAVCEGLSNIAEERGRSTVIDPLVVAMASREFDYHNFRIKSEIKRINNMQCTACGTHPLFCHCDGNVKLYRFTSSGDHGDKSLYEGIVFVPDTQIIDFVNQINAHIPQKTTKHDSCGSSTFKAGKLDGTGSQFRKMDETGFISMACRHSIVLQAGNMYRGETYRLVAFFHMLAAKMNILFFCYDVVCRYWSFAKKVSNLGKLGKLSKELNEIVSKLVTEMLPFLSRFHGQAHAWFCMVLWFGYFQKYAAACIGEEQEQAFAHLSRYAYKTRKNTKRNRHELLSKGVLFSNEDKNNRMVVTLVKRLSNARKRIPQYEKLLNEHLVARKKVLSDMPKMLQNLITQARLVKDRKLKSDWPLENLQIELEGVSCVMRKISSRDMKKADSCQGPQGRNPLRHKLTYLKKRGTELIRLINEKVGSITVTEQMRVSGIFPWQTGQCNVEEDLKIIDAWMLWKRFQEEEVQTRKEMCNYLKGIDGCRNTLLEDIDHLKKEDMSPYNLGLIGLKLEEIDRLETKLAKAVFYFDVNILEEGLLDDELSESETFTDSALDGDKGSDSLLLGNLGNFYNSSLDLSSDDEAIEDSSDSAPSSEDEEDDIVITRADMCLT